MNMKIRGSSNIGLRIRFKVKIVKNRKSINGKLIKINLPTVGRS